MSVHRTQLTGHVLTPQGFIRGALTISALLISTVRATDAMARRKTRQKVLDR